VILTFRVEKIIKKGNRSFAFIHRKAQTRIIAGRSPGSVHRFLPSRQSQWFRRKASFR